MKSLIVLFYIFSCFEASAQMIEVLPVDLEQLSRVMTIPTMDAVVIQSSRRSSVRCEDAPLQGPELEPIRIQKKPSKWLFSVQATLGGPTDTFTKEYLSTNQPVLKNELNAFIRQDFSSYEDRMGAVAELCAGKSDLEKIQLGGILGGQLGNIYDYGRANSGVNSTDYVSSEMQWEALRNGTAAGVCRDAALTITQFLNACGIDPKRMSIDSYRSMSGGHQVVTIRGADGKPYTINWSELYSQNENNRTALAPSPSIVNTDIFYRSYDPITGVIREERRTELGEVLRVVTGGKTDDPNFFPQLLRLEATNGTLGASVFATETQRGDFAKGVSAFYKSESSTGLFVTSVGVAYANNRRDVSISPSRNETLEQDIFYMGGDITVRPVITLYEREQTRIALNPSLRMSPEMYYSINRFKSGSTSATNMNVRTTGAIGGTVSIEGSGWEAWFGGESQIGFSRNKYNTQRATDSDSPLGGAGFYQTSWSLTGGGSVKTGDVDVAVSSEMIVSRTDVQKHVGVTLKDTNDRWRLGAVYSIYDRRYGTREDYIGVEGEKTWSLERVGDISLGASVQTAIAGRDDTAAKVTLKWRP